MLTEFVLQTAIMTIHMIQVLEDLRFKSSKAFLSRFLYRVSIHVDISRYINTKKNYNNHNSQTLKYIIYPKIFAYAYSFELASSGSFFASV